MCPELPEETDGKVIDKMIENSEPHTSFHSWDAAETPPAISARSKANKVIVVLLLLTPPYAAAAGHSAAHSVRFGADRSYPKRPSQDMETARVISKAPVGTLRPPPGSLISLGSVRKLRLR